MMNRRVLARRVAIAMLGTYGTWLRRCLPCSLVLALQRLSADETSDTKKRVESPPSQLLDALDRLSKRTYAEEGIPMILACSDIVASDGLNTKYRERRDENRPILEAFQRYVDALPQVRSDTSADDVAKIVELLADDELKSDTRSF